MSHHRSEFRDKMENQQKGPTDNNFFLRHRIMPLALMSDQKLNIGSHLYGDNNVNVD